MPNLLTKKEIINIWNQSDQKLNDSKCCPFCRDNLSETNEGYTCSNPMCLNGDIYSITPNSQGYHEIIKTENKRNV